MAVGGTGVLVGVPGPGGTSVAVFVGVAVGEAGTGVLVASASNVVAVLLGTRVGEAVSVGVLLGTCVGVSLGGTGV